MNIDRRNRDGLGSSWVTAVLTRHFWSILELECACTQELLFVMNSCYNGTYYALAGVDFYDPSQNMLR